MCLPHAPRRSLAARRSRTRSPEPGGCARSARDDPHSIQTRVARARDTRRPFLLAVPQAAACARRSLPLLRRDAVSIATRFAVRDSQVAEFAASQFAVRALARHGAHTCLDRKCCPAHAVLRSLFASS